MAIKPSISPISAQIAGFLSIISYPKPLFTHLAYSISPNNSLNSQKVEIQPLDNRYTTHG